MREIQVSPLFIKAVAGALIFFNNNSLRKEKWQVLFLIAPFL